MLMFYLHRLQDVTLVIRKKLRASQHKVVIMALRLLETLTTNCGDYWYMALNDPKMTGDLAGCARKFANKSGADNKDVSDTALDIIQGWGEAFLSRKKQFPNIVELYFNLRKEGLPFKVDRQFDPSRVPIFARPGASAGGGEHKDSFLDHQTDGILAATIQASMDLEAENRQKQGLQRATSTPMHSSGPVTTQQPTANTRNLAGEAAMRRANSSSVSSSTAGRGGGAAPRGTPSQQARPATTTSSSSGAAKKVDTAVDSLNTSMTILKELILASSTAQELKSNEVIEDILEQIRSYQGEIHTLIEAAMEHPDLLANLFKANDGSQTLISLYSDIKDGTLTLVEGKKVITALDGGAGDHHQQSKGVTNDLLDYDDSSSSNTAANQNNNNNLKPAASSSSTVHNDLDFFNAPAATQSTNNTAAPFVADFADFGAFPSSSSSASNNNSNTNILPVAQPLSHNTQPYQPHSQQPIPPANQPVTATPVHHQPQHRSSSGAIQVNISSFSPPQQSPQQQRTSMSSVPRLAPPPSSSSRIAPPLSTGMAPAENYYGSNNNAARRPSTESSLLSPVNNNNNNSSNNNNAVAAAKPFDPFGNDILLTLSGGAPAATANHPAPPPMASVTTSVPLVNNSTGLMGGPQPMSNPQMISMMGASAAAHPPHPHPHPVGGAAAYGGKRHSLCFCIFFR
jgi:hypothetical protein